MNKNDKSLYFRDWTTKKLKQEAKNYNELIYKMGCYGSCDMKNLAGIELELQKRNIIIK